MPDKENKKPVEPENEEEILKEAGNEAAKDAETVAEEVNAEASENTKEAEEADDSAEEAEVLEEDPEEKKGFFSRKKDKKIAELDEKNQQLTDRLQRLMAEFDNYRKRTEKEKSSMFDNGVMKAVEKILPVVDNFERGISSVPEEDRDDQFYKGMDQIYKQLLKVLSDLGVEPMETMDKPFDLNLHNAVLQVPSDEEEKSGMVAQELQKGYTYKGNVLRHAMVSVYE